MLWSASSIPKSSALRVWTALLLLFLAGNACAIGDRPLSIGTYFGIHQPAIEDLNQGEFRSPVSGNATIVDFNSDAVSNEYLVFPNALPEVKGGANMGLEVQWDLDDNYAAIVGVGTWEATSRAVIQGSLAVQGTRSELVGERIARLSYNEFYFGARRNVIVVPKKYKIYYRATLGEMFDIDYREDLMFHFLTGPAEGVNKSIILLSQATGLLTLQAGFGGEYYVNDWLSFGMDMTYLTGFRRIHLRDGSSYNDFLFSDNLNLYLPQRINPATGNLEYMRPSAAGKNDYEQINLSFDGWKILIRASLHY